MASITSLIILGIVLCNALNSNISIEATFSCNSYTSGSITPSHDTIFYLFNNSEQEYNESYSVLFDLCPSTFDTILYLYDQDLNELYCNDDSDSCNGHQSQLLFYLSQPLYIIQIGGHNSEFGTFYLNITCNYNDALHPPSIFITNQPTSLTLEPSYAPSHPPSGNIYIYILIHVNI